MIKPIETEYKGYKFRSRLEARWAVFFDACGVKWEYEPEGFELDDGTRYLPDFLLHDVHFKFDAPSTYDLWVEVKGVMTAADLKKIRKFNGPDCENRVLVLPNIPIEESYDGLASEVLSYRYEEPFFNFLTVMNDWYPAFPCVTKKGDFVLLGGDYETESPIDKKRTYSAYKKARQARFEYGENGG